MGQSESVNQRRTDNSVQKKKNKKTNNDLQSITYKTTDPAIQTQLKQGVSSGAPEGLAVPAPLVTPVVVSYSHVKNQYHHHIISLKLEV